MAPALPCRSRRRNAWFAAFHERHHPYRLSDGTVAADSIKVEESSGNARLDAAAKAEAATRWRFLPATENGVPVESDHKFRVVFSLAHAGGGVMEMPAEDFPGSLKDDGELYVPLNMGLDGR